MKDKLEWNIERIALFSSLLRKYSGAIDRSWASSVERAEVLHEIFEKTCGDPEWLDFEKRRKESGLFT